MENGLDYILWDMKDNLDKTEWNKQKRDLILKVAKVKKLNLMELLESKIPHNPDEPWYSKIANKVTGVANSYKRTFMEQYGPALAEFMIKQQLTVGTFMNNFSANMIAFKEFLVNYFKEEQGESEEL